MPGPSEECRLSRHDGIFAAAFAIGIVQLQDSKRVHGQAPICLRWPGPALGLLPTALARFLTGLARCLEVPSLLRLAHITEDIGHRSFGERHLTPKW